MNRCILLILFFCTSCQVYRAGFDCPPQRGIPCTSVTDIEKMIIETEEGPDLLVESKRSNCCKKVWIADGDYYIFLEE